MNAQVQVTITGTELMEMRRDGYLSKKGMWYLLGGITGEITLDAIKDEQELPADSPLTREEVKALIAAGINASREADEVMAKEQVSNKTGRKIQ